MACEWCFHQSLSPFPLSAPERVGLWTDARTGGRCPGVREPRRVPREGATRGSDGGRDRGQAQAHQTVQRVSAEAAIVLGLLVNAGRSAWSGKARHGLRWLWLTSIAKPGNNIYSLMTATERPTRRLHQEPRSRLDADGGAAQPSLPPAAAAGDGGTEGMMMMMERRRRGDDPETRHAVRVAGQLIS